MKFMEAFGMIAANPSLTFFTAHLTKELVRITICIFIVLALITKINSITICSFFLLTKNISWRPRKKGHERGILRDKREIILI